MTAVAVNQWKSFARAFSKEHDGWSSSLQSHRDGVVEVAIDDRPFRGAVVEERGGRNALVLMFGDDPDEHLAHIIEQPRELAVLDDEAGHCSLLIGLPDGSGCVLDLVNPFNTD